MTNKSTKKALLLSVLSMLMCVAMLVGTTFAWFTDSVTSGKNTIMAGNLDIELEYSKTPDVDTSWATVKDKDDLLNKDALWEPGHAEVVYLKLSNLGTLALKYQFSMNVYDTTPGISVLGNEIHLADYLEYGIVDYTAEFETREEAIAAVKDSAIPLENYAVSGQMLKGDTKVVALVVYMPTTVGNEANYKTGTTAPSIELGVNVFATQLVYESDFFGPDYDAAAPWTGDVDLGWYDPDATELTIDTPEELAGFAAIVNGTATAPVTTFAATSEETTIHDTFAGKTVNLAADIDLNDIAWTPVGRIGAKSTDFTYAFKGTFDGNGHTVSNVVVNNEGWAGLFGVAYKATIKNVTVKDAKIDSNRMAGAVVGQIYGNVENCHVKDSFIKVIPNAVGDTYDNGDKVGGVVGWIGDNGNNHNLINCSATNVDVIGYRDIGGIAGYVAWSTTVSGNKVTKADLTIDQITNHYGEKDANAGLIWGRNSVSSSGVGVNASNNTEDADSTIAMSYLADGMQIRKDGVSGETTLYLVPADYEDNTVNVPEGVTAIGNYAFAYNSNVETVKLSSTVTDLGRGFDSSTVKKVVLNEGLETISSRAFRSTTALEEVVISSTVTTIADNAFQKSGIKTVIIPANVETIGETAFGASKVETVIIEGDTSIQGFAFRGCPDLRNVYLKGDVTFIASTLNGRNSIWFCNGESNNPNTSNITFYVKDETVAARVKTAMGAEANNTPVIIGEVEATKEPAAVKEALANGNTVVLTEDVATEADTAAPYGNKVGVVMNGGVLDGNGNKLDVECYGDDYGIMTTGGTIKNLTVENGCRAVMIMYPTEDVILDNVNIGGDGVLYTINTGEAGAAPVKLIVTNSTLAGWTSYGDGAISSASFTNVKFEQGTYYNNIYGRVLKPYVNTTLTDCSFIEHMNLDLSSLAEGQKVTITNCTVNGQAVTADVFTVPTTDAEYDTELFTVDLPSWATNINDCVIFN